MRPDPKSHAPPAEARVTPTADGAIIHDPRVFGATADPRWFDPAFWTAHGPLAAPAGGRGGAWLVDTPAGPALLRHYRRGGLVARFNQDRYFWRDADSTRPFREFHLLSAAAAEGLDAPAPLAARYARAGIWYRADILLRAIPEVESLAQRLRLAPGTIPWAGVGRTIACFHGAGFLHADLNAHNILVGPRDRVWLVDFDRGERRVPAADWTQANLARLYRSLVKLEAPERVVGFEREAWPALAQAHARGCAQSAEPAA
jgi:3-deoxy-D-manno-octulosonic acid kinase